MVRQKTGSNKGFLQVGRLNKPQLIIYTFYSIQTRQNDLANE